MVRFWASASRRDVAGRAAILFGVMLAAPVVPAGAQTTLGRSSGPDVIVNESVIDALGPPALPGPVRQENPDEAGSAGLRPFHLHPPAHRTATVAKPNPSVDQQAPQTASAVSRTAIPGKPRLTAKGKSQPIEQASAPAAGTPPQPMSSAPAPSSAAASSPQPAQSTPAGASALPPAAEPTPTAPASPVNSIVRRYPAGTGAAILAASHPPASNPPAAPPQPSTPQAAAPAPSTPAPSPAPATTVTAPAAQPAQPAAPAMPAPAVVAQPSPPPVSAPAPAQIAALPPGGGLPAIPAQIVFAANGTDMPDQAKATLDNVVSAMKTDEQIRIQLIAYASGLPDQANAARRTSLSRAVSVRAYLVEQGVKSVRIDVRAMGNRSDGGGPQDRVDIVPIDR